MSNNDVKILVAFAVAAAVIFVAMIIGSSYTDVPRQFGDKVCIKVGKELKCEPISQQD